MEDKQIVEGIDKALVEQTPLSPTNEKSKKTKPLIICIILGIIFSLVFNAIRSNKTEQNQPIHKDLSEVANEMNARCPVMLDKETRFDNVVALSDKELQLTFTLVNLDKTTTDVDGLQKELIPFLTNYLKSNIKKIGNTNLDIQFLKEKRTIFTYHYLDMKGESLLELTLTPEGYENPKEL